MSSDSDRGRDPSDISPQDYRQACDELISLVAERLPERFYRGEPLWRMATTALLARAVRLLQSTAILLEASHAADALVLLRSLYEHAVTFCWLMIDPPVRAERWGEHASRLRLTVHREALRYNVAVLTDEQVEAAEDAAKLPSLEQRTDEVDAYWGARSPAFRPADTTGIEHMLTMRGLYTGLYRITSRGQHAQLDALDPCLETDRYPWRVVLDDHSDGSLVVLGLPLTALMLAAGAERLGWPDIERLRPIVDALMRQTASED